MLIEYALALKLYTMFLFQSQLSNQEQIIPLFRASRSLSDWEKENNFDFAIKKYYIERQQSDRYAG